MERQEEELSQMVQLQVRRWQVERRLVWRGRRRWQVERRLVWRGRRRSSLRWFRYSRGREKEYGEQIINGSGTQGGFSSGHLLAVWAPPGVSR